MLEMKLKCPIHKSILGFNSITCETCDNTVLFRPIGQTYSNYLKSLGRPLKHNVLRYTKIHFCGTNLNDRTKYCSFCGRMIRHSEVSLAICVKGKIDFADRHSSADADLF